MAGVQPKVYLAGTGVFKPRAALYGDHLKSVAAQYGLIGLFPLDNEVADNRDRIVMAMEIYRGNLRMMQEADAIVADISPFRGPNMDPGTAFEVGYVTALGKPCFAWSRERTTLFERTARGFTDRNQKRDRDGLLVEDFGLVENLMIALPAGRIHACVRDALADAADRLITQTRKAS